jgi:SAM-dependent methyltransferase
MAERTRSCLEATLAEQTKAPARSGADAIYDRPRDYDLEHEGDDEDVRFYIELVRRLRPARVLELAAGSGRVTIPLADSVAGQAIDIVGLELADSMLEEAERKRSELSPEAQARVRFVQGDLREWSDTTPFDLVITPCGTLSHFLSIDDQVAAWTRAHDNLAPGGRFLVDLTMPDHAAYADSLQTPPRTPVEIDIDTEDPDTGVRLLRYKTTEYLPHEQRARIRFIYDKLGRDGAVDRYVSDFESHVYYPREVDLLFRLTGFDVEHRYGNYYMRPLKRTSRALIVIGRRR